MVLTKSTDIHLRASADGSKEHKKEAKIEPESLAPIPWSSAPRI